MTIGIQPSEFWRMSHWQTRVVFIHHIAAHQPEGPVISESDMDELWDWMADKPATVRLAH